MALVDLNDLRDTAGILLFGGAEPVGGHPCLGYLHCERGSDDFAADAQHVGIGV